MSETSSPIRMHWWNLEPNFGDALAPKLVEHVTGRKVVWATAQEAELIGLGSILEVGIQEGLRRGLHGGPALCAWGSGLLRPLHVEGRRWGSLNLAAVRGPLSASCLESDGILQGDPGLLAGDLYAGAATGKEFLGGIVFHHTQKISEALREHLRSRRWLAISTATADCDAVVAQMSSCEVILSASLHGLVVADALRIPNDWLDLGRIHAAGRFKFYDYALSVMRRLSPPVDGRRVNFLSEFERIKCLDFSYWSQFDEIKQKLRSSLVDTLEIRS